MMRKSWPRKYLFGSQRSRCRARQVPGLGAVQPVQCPQPVLVAWARNWRCRCSMAVPARRRWSRPAPPNEQAAATTARRRFRGEAGQSGDDKLPPQPWRSAKSSNTEARALATVSAGCRQQPVPRRHGGIPQRHHRAGPFLSAQSATDTYAAGLAVLLLKKNVAGAVGGGAGDLGAALQTAESAG